MIILRKSIIKGKDGEKYYDLFFFMQEKNNLSMAANMSKISLM